MSSETFVSAMLLITGVVAAAILIVAVLPVIWGMVGTFSSASAATDRSMRTDFKIVTTYSKFLTSPPSPAGANVTVWMKNIGTAKIGTTELNSADVFVGRTDNFARAARIQNPVLRGDKQWWYTFNLATGDLNNNGFWDPGETLQVDTFCTSVTASGQYVYFQYTLPNSVSRSAEFTAS